MYDLPPEMLFAIFKACIGAKDHRQPLVLSHVCRQWRSIALADPSLWTQLRIHRTWQDLHAYLERSRPMPVDLTIVCTSQARWVIADFVHEQLSRPEYQHDLRRIRSMDLVAWSNEELDQLMLPMKGVDFPHLASLRVQVHARQQTAHWGHQHSHTPLLPAHTPKLSSITLVNKCTDCLRDTTKLTKLELHSFPGPFDCRVMEIIIRASPVLERLVLGELDYLWHNQGEQKTQAESCRIKHLRIAGSSFSKCRGSAFSPRYYCLLRTLVAGNLKSLEITGGHQEALCHLIPSIKKRSRETPPLDILLCGSWETSAVVT
jgi:hypothetical protein